MKKYAIAGYACLAALLSVPSANAGTIVLGGTYAANLALVLTNLGISYVDATGDIPDPTGYGAGDTIIVGQDGGLTIPPDYNAFLNAGGHFVVAGGSNDDNYRIWVSQYFNITDTGIGWHTDGDWHSGPATSPHTYSLPVNYTFEDNAVSYHMLAFLPGPNTTLLGTNDEGNYIAAIRDYANGGYFYYMAIDPGRYGTSNDIQSFTTPFVQGIFATATPEPATSAAMGGGLILLGLVLRRRRS
jgi:hypothetical protein